MQRPCASLTRAQVQHSYWMCGECLWDDFDSVGLKAVIERVMNLSENAIRVSCGHERTLGSAWQRSRLRSTAPWWTPMSLTVCTGASSLIQSHPVDAGQPAWSSAMTLRCLTRAWGACTTPTTTGWWVSIYNTGCLQSNRYTSKKNILLCMTDFHGGRMRTQIKVLKEAHNWNGLDSTGRDRTMGALGALRSFRFQCQACFLGLLAQKGSIWLAGNVFCPEEDIFCEKILLEDDVTWPWLRVLISQQTLMHRQSEPDVLCRRDRGYDAPVDAVGPRTMTKFGNFALAANLSFSVTSLSKSLL